MAFDHTPQTQCIEDQKEPKEKRFVFCRGYGGAFGRDDSQEWETGSGVRILGFGSQSIIQATLHVAWEASKVRPQAGLGQ